MSRPVSGWVPGERLAGRVPEPERDDDAPMIGVLALQGDVLEHLRALRRCGANALRVRSAPQLAGLDALILPGGESTTIGKLLERLEMLVPLRERVRAGMPTFGTCAGMILLSAELDQAQVQPLIGGLDIRTRRNAFGRQIDSFDVAIEVAGLGEAPLDVSFIRAPRVERLLSEEVEVLATVEGFPVVVRQGAVLATAFHAEVAGDDRLHAAFIAGVRGT